MRGGTRSYTQRQSPRVAEAGGADGTGPSSERGAGGECRAQLTKSTLLVKRHGDLGADIAARVSAPFSITPFHSVEVAHV